ncbi:hypothetical protein PINS_up004827 [Pythium insidiosum]|nr:hypothetical protein PINS_up004827 [Pythium insidiosum]
MDELMLQYLRKKGYHIEPQAPKTDPSSGGDVEMADAPPATLANGVTDHGSSRREDRADAVRGGQATVPGRGSRE